MGGTKLRRSILAGCLALGATAISVAQPTPVSAATRSVATEAQFRQALTDLSVIAGPHTIEITANFVVAGATSPTYTGASALTINGNGHTISGNSNSRILQTDTDAEVTIDSVTFHDGTSPTLGGAVYSVGDLTVTNSHLHDNAAPRGGAIMTFGASLTVRNSVFEDNRATGGGFPVAEGGAILVGGPNLLIENSSFRRNVADGNQAQGGAAFSDGLVEIVGSSFESNGVQAVGLSAGGAVQSLNEVAVTNSTFSENTADGVPAVGSAVSSFGATNLTHATIVGDGDASLVHGDLTSFGSVLARRLGVADKCSGPSATSLGYNFAEGAQAPDPATDTSCGFTQTGDTQGSPLSLRPLTDNGGPTRTISFAGTSLIDAIPPGFCAAGVVTDQRGQARGGGLPCDIGAVEAGPVTVSVEQAVGQADPAATTPVRFTVEFSEPVTDFTAADLVLGGSASGGSADLASTSDPSIYAVTRQGMSSGTVTVAVRAGSVRGVLGELNEASTSVDNTVTFTPAVVPPSSPAPPTFVPLTPARILDTRAGSKVGNGAGTGEPLTLSVLGRGGVPSSGVGALALNVTVVAGEDPDIGGGFVTVFPCGTRPDASNLNFSAGQTIPNSVIAPLSASGTVCFYVYGTAHLLADVSGYFPAGSSFTSLTPARILDTRAGSKVGNAAGTGEPLTLAVLGEGGVPPSGVGAVALNVTVVAGEDPDIGGGFVTVFPCGTRPDASNLNFSAGQTIPNSVIAPLSASGTVCFYVYGTAHLLADVSGYFPVGTGFETLTPSRILDTRAAAKVGNAAGTGEPLTLSVLGEGGVPPNGVSAVALNVTVVAGEDPDIGGGFVTVFPCGTRPDASNLNFSAGQTIPNSVIAPLSASGTVCFYVYGTAHLLADVSGYFPS